MRILVLGGNGFVGRAVCRAALNRRWEVTSLSRHGAPSKKAPDAVDWQQGSALDTARLATLAKGTDYIVNCIGTLIEGPPDSTYENLNYRVMASTLTALKQSGAHPKAVAYVSAASFDPFTRSLLARYYETKGRAEKDLLDYSAASKTSALVFRPSLVYGWDRPATVVSAFFFRILTLFSAGLFPPPIQVDRLAASVISHLDAGYPPGTQRTIEVADM